MKNKLFFAIDLEMEQPSNEILSIGVAYQTIEYEDVMVPDSRTVYLVPHNRIFRKNYLITPSKPVSPFIQELTGLKDEMFDWSKSRKQCFSEFMKAHVSTIENMEKFEEYKYHNEAITWGCGDVALLRQQLYESEIEIRNVHKRFIDCKTLVMLTRHFCNKSISGRMGLKSGLHEFGLKFEGSEHDSSWDAYNTLKLFEAYSEKMYKMNSIVEMVKTL